MRIKATACLMVTAAAAGICLTQAGCGTGASAQARAGSTLAATRPGESRSPGHAARSRRASAADTAARNRAPRVSSARPSRAAAPPPASHAPSAGRTARLTSGLYTDAPDGTPHYVLSFSSAAGSAVRGSASFLYQDGRIATVGSLAGTLSRSGKITLTLGDGKALPGRFAGGRLSLPGCARVLPLARAAGGCTFTYHGHVP